MVKCCNNRSDNSSGISFFSCPIYTEEQVKKEERWVFDCYFRKDLDVTALLLLLLQDLQKALPFWQTGLYLYHTTDPDWLPTLHLDHCHSESSTLWCHCGKMEKGSKEREMEENRRVVARFSSWGSIDNHCRID